MKKEQKFVNLYFLLLLVTVLTCPLKTKAASSIADICQEVAEHYNQINNTDIFVVMEGEAVQTEVGYRLVLRHNGSNTPNVFVSGIYINIGTGEVKDDGGNTWFLKSDAEEETITEENNEFLEGQKEAYCQVINQLETEYNTFSTAVGDYEYAVGLCYLELWDIDKDGNSELLAVFNTGERDSRDNPVYVAQVYRYSNGNAVLAGECGISHANGYGQSISWTEFAGQRYFASDLTEAIGTNYYAIDEKGKFSPLHGFVEEFPVGGGMPLDYFDEILIETEEQWAEFNEWIGNRQYINVCCDPEIEALENSLLNIKNRLGYEADEWRNDTTEPYNEKIEATLSLMEKTYGKMAPEEYLYVQTVEDFLSDKKVFERYSVADLIVSGKADDVMPDKERYKKTLLNLYTLYEKDTADIINEINLSDNTRKFTDKSLEISEILSGSIDMLIESSGTSE